MFEQSVLPQAPGRSSTAILTATSLQVLILIGAVATPLFFIAPLPAPKPPRFLLKYLPHVILVPVGMHPFSPTPQRGPVFSVQPLRAPAHIPSQIADIHDLPAPDIGASQTGVPSDGSDNLAAAVGSVPILTEIAPPAPARPKPAAQPKGPVLVSQGVQQAKLINQVIPRYPELAKQTRQFGTVHLVAVIGKDGRVKEIQAIDGPVFLRQAAVEAVKQWVYRPTLLNGLPVEVLAPIDIHFTLDR